jgi:hypothetical protein
LSRVWVSYKTGFWTLWSDLSTPFTFTEFQTTGNIKLSLNYTLYSVEHATGFSVSLVVSWKQMYHSLTVTSTQTRSLLDTVWILSCYYFAAAISEDSTTP